MPLAIRRTHLLAIVGAVAALTTGLGLAESSADVGRAGLPTRLVPGDAPALVMLRAAHRPTGAAREVRIAGDGGDVTERTVHPHPACRCAAPPESDWAPADAPADPRPTRRATASAGHG